MDEIKIGEALEEQEKKEEQQKVEQVLKEGGRHDVRNIIIISAVVILILAFSLGGSKLYNRLTAAGVAETIDLDKLHEWNRQGKLSEERGYTYKGFSFVKNEGMWWTELMRFGTKVKIPLHFGPKEIEFIKIEGELEPGFNQGEEVFIAIDPQVANKYYTLALAELNFNIAKGIDRKPIGSCTQEDPICEDRTIISCQNTSGKPVIELALENKTVISLQGTCIKVTGEGYELVKAVDRLLYRWYKIME